MELKPEDTVQDLLDALVEKLLPKIQERLDGRELATKSLVESLIDEYNPTEHMDFEDAVERIIEDKLDLDDRVREALDNYDLADKIKDILRHEISLDISIN